MHNAKSCVQRGAGDGEFRFYPPPPPPPFSIDIQQIFSIMHNNLLFTTQRSKTQKTKKNPLTPEHHTPIPSWGKFPVRACMQITRDYLQLHIRVTLFTTLAGFFCVWKLSCLLNFLRHLCSPH